MKTGVRTCICCFLAAVLFVSGCAPVVHCQIVTEILPDYTCRRVMQMEAFPSQRFPTRRPRLSDYFNFPPPEYYDSYTIEQDKAFLAGEFESFDKIPSDLVRPTPGTQDRAGNLMSYRVMDFVLFVLADFDETITDIVKSREDGEAALDELIRLVVPEVMSVLQAKYGAKYDLSRLDAWLNTELPAKLRRIYAAAIAIHGAKRSGVTSAGEDEEFYAFLMEEARRDGLELAPPGTPNMEEENIRRLREYGVRLALHLCQPRPGTTETGRDALSNISVDDLLSSVQMAIAARHGSINNYISKVAALVPRAFGAYLTGMVMPMYMLPSTQYQYRLRVPGRILQTNGVTELDGTLVWNFADRDIAFSGFSMWCRSIFVRDAATYSMGLRGFPASLADVDAMFRLSIDESGAPREAVLTALQQCVAARSFSPLEALSTNTASADSAAARGMLELFARHRRQAAAPAQAAPAPQGALPDLQP